MIKFREKQYSSSFLRGLKRQGKVYMNLAKKAMHNPGHVLRKTAAGVTKDPINGAVQVTARVQPIPQVGNVTMALSPQISKVSKKTIPLNTRKKLRKTSKEIMSDSGKTKASRFGRNLEYRTNDALIKASNIAQMIPI